MWSRVDGVGVEGSRFRDPDAKPFDTPPEISVDRNPAYP